ncbi:sensor histidine kinase [Hymenobacter volaticus]|uniref:Histidine kinase n=1 Tax=Hymenobacter volaticus TaxID=2932254 RepID=A0ABY4G509_9BACT|nr:histidine kinase [Hymenobacter volaticus]UOQ65898.1 histidine kinase [Hymenobacter volaticus]
MPLFTFRQAQTFLLHALAWMLLGMLLALQPPGRLPQTPFYLLQAALFVVSLGVFYLNVYWAVPRLLYGRRLLSYGAFVVVMAIGVSLPYRQLQNELEKRYRSQRFNPNFPSPNVNSRWPEPPPGGRRKHPGESRRWGWRQDWVNPAVLLSTLLVLGLGTSVAAVQRGQRESQIRQALEQEKLSTELAWLKAQINPHFFFNTLNNIYALTLLDGDQAREAIHRLSRMMRYVLYDTQNGTAPLSQELLFVRDYIDLMQLRLTDNVRVEYETPAVVHEAPIAPMLLLTFIENAFKHGVSALAPSHIRIVVRQPTPHTLEVEVRNSVFEDRPLALDENQGIGLANTRRRLALLYPDRHTLTVTELTPEHEYYVHLTLSLQS